MPVRQATAEEEARWTAWQISGDEEVQLSWIIVQMVAYKSGRMICQFSEDGEAR